jgi:hypothetical protein
MGSPALPENESAECTGRPGWGNSALTVTRAYGVFMALKYLPDIELSGFDGKPVRLQDFVGRRLAVFMWASW